MSFVKIHAMIRSESVPWYHWNSTPFLALCKARISLLNIQNQQWPQKKSRTGSYEIDFIIFNRNELQTEFYLAALALIFHGRNALDHVEHVGEQEPKIPHRILQSVYVFRICQRLCVSHSYIDRIFPCISLSLSFSLIYYVHVLKSCWHFNLELKGTFYAKHVLSDSRVPKE